MSCSFPICYLRFPYSIYPLRSASRWPKVAISGRRSSRRAQPTNRGPPYSTPFAVTPSHLRSPYWLRSVASSSTCVPSPISCCSSVGSNQVPFTVQFGVFLFTSKWFTVCYFRSNFGKEINSLLSDVAVIICSVMNTDIPIICGLFCFWNPIWPYALLCDAVFLVFLHVLDALFAVFLIRGFKYSIDLDWYNFCGCWIRFGKLDCDACLSDIVLVMLEITCALIGLCISIHRILSMPGCIAVWW